MVELDVVEVVLLLLRLNVAGLELEALAFLLLRLDFRSLCAWRNALILQYVTQRSFEQNESNIGDSITDNNEAGVQPKNHVHTRRTTGPYVFAKTI